MNEEIKVNNRKLLKHLIERPTISRAKWLNKISHYMNSDEFDASINVLIDIGLVEQFKSGSSNDIEHGRVYYRLKIVEDNRGKTPWLQSNALSNIK